MFLIKWCIMSVARPLKAGHVSVSNLLIFPNHVMKYSEIIAFYREDVNSLGSMKLIAV